MFQLRTASNSSSNADMLVIGGASANVSAGSFIFPLKHPNSKLSKNLKIIENQNLSNEADY